MNPILTKIEEELAKKVTEFAPELEETYKKVVLAGDKIMFDPKTHQHMEIVKNPEARKDPVNTLANGVTGLMWIMYQQSKQQMDVKVLIMAGTTLLVHAIDFAERGIGITFDNAMIGQASQNLAYNLFKRLGITPEQIHQAVQQGAEEIKTKQSGAA